MVDSHSVQWKSFGDNELNSDNSIKFRVIDAKSLISTCRSNDECYFIVNFYLKSDSTFKLVKSVTLKSSECFDEEILQYLYNMIREGSDLEFMMKNKPIIFSETLKHSPDTILKISSKKISKNNQIDDVILKIYKLEFELIVYEFMKMNKYDKFKESFVENLHEKAKNICMTDSNDQYSTRISQILSLCELYQSLFDSSLNLSPDHESLDKKEISKISNFLDESINKSEDLCMKIMNFLYDKNEIENSEKLCRSFLSINPNSKYAIKFLSNLYIAKYRNKMTNSIPSTKILSKNQIPQNQNIIRVSNQISNIGFKSIILIFLSAILILLITLFMSKIF